MLNITITKEINGKKEKVVAVIDEDSATLSEFNQEVHSLIGVLLDREADSQ